jgi:hypothetical protein
MSGGGAEGRILSLVALVTAPGLVWAAWPSTDHAVSSALIAPAVALVPFVCLPLLAARALALTPGNSQGQEPNHRSFYLELCFAVCCLMAVVLYAGREHGRFRGLLTEPTRYPKMLAFAGKTYARLAPDPQENAIGQQIETYAQGIPLNDSVTLVDYRLSRVRSQRHRLGLLFRTVQPVLEDGCITVLARVPDEFRNRLPHDRQALGYDDWSFTPDPPLSMWPADGLAFVATDVVAEPIPYELHVSLTRRAWMGAAYEQVRLSQEVVVAVKNPADQSEPAFIRNPGFERWEDGLPWGWTPRPGHQRFAVRATDCVAEGASALETGPGYNYTTYRQPVPVYGALAGKTVVVRARALSREPAGNLAIEAGAQASYGPAHPGDGVWRTLWATYAAPYDFNEDTITVVLGHGGSPRSACLFDDVTIEVR